MALADNSSGNFLTTAVLPSALKQDPRYFEMGQGGLASGRLRHEQVGGHTH